MKISLRRRYALMVEDSAFSHNMDYFTIILTVSVIKAAAPLSFNIRSHKAVFHSIGQASAILLFSIFQMRITLG